MKNLFTAVLFLTLLQSKPVLAQDTYSDSLVKLLSSNKHDTSKIKILNRLAYYLTDKSPRLAATYCKESLAMSKKIGFKRENAKGHVYYAIILNNSAGIGDVYKHLDTALAVFTELKDKTGLAWTFSIYGDMYGNKGEYKKALEYLFKNLKLNEELKNKNSYAWACVGIGNTYIQLGQLDNAERYMNEALKTMKLIEDQQGVATSYNGLGMINDYKGNNKQAVDYYTRSLNFQIENNNKLDAIGILGNIGVVCFNDKQYPEALSYFDRAVKMAKEIDYPQGIGSSYVNMGEVFIAKKQYDKAILFLKKGLAIIDSLHFTDNIAETHRLLYEAYYKKNDFKNALIHKDQYTLLKDSMLNSESNRSIAEMGAKYESEKKEQENKLLQKENELSVKTIRQQQTTAYFIGSALILVVLLAIFIYKGLKQQRTANSIISIQKKEVENQKHLVEEKQKEIVDSINYAQRIQYSLLANEELLQKNIPEHFVLFNPKDIVSGDFYWAASVKNKQNSNELFYLACCDSTGHGVPGAFMCLLNIGFLSEAINEKNIYEPSEVFDYVRERLVGTISKEGKQDGFDGILLCFDRANNTITYSAANNSPVIINHGVLKSLEADKMPVGLGERKEGFKLHSISAEKEQTLYLYTDGYADQFGGPKGKKFKYRPLNDLLCSISSLPMKEQKKILEKEFESWKGNMEQVDDVCIIGIRL
ncbi:MAG: tetratricopeptide repeat protein, partial [Bacteroidia bacterium]